MIIIIFLILTGKDTEQVRHNLFTDMQPRSSAWLQVATLQFMVSALKLQASQCYVSLLRKLPSTHVNLILFALLILAESDAFFTLAVAYTSGFVCTPAPFNIQKKH